MRSPCAVIAGTGHALPPTIITNHDLAARVDTYGAVLGVSIGSDGTQEELITVPDRQ